MKRTVLVPIDVRGKNVFINPAAVESIEPSGMKRVIVKMMSGAEYTCDAESGPVGFAGYLAEADHAVTIAEDDD